MSLSKDEQVVWAASGGELEKVKSLCSDPVVDLNWQHQKFGVTALHGACKNGRVEVVKYLLSLKEIDPNKPTNEGVTPFFIACQEGHKEVVSMLLSDPRVDPMKPANEGSTPILVACQNGRKDAVILLLADPRIDPNKTGSHRATPLCYASQQGHLVVVQHLLASGKEIDTKIRSTWNNRRAAELARASNFHPIADLIDSYLESKPSFKDYVDHHWFSFSFDDQQRHPHKIKFDATQGRYNNDVEYEDTSSSAVYVHICGFSACVRCAFPHKHRM